MYGAAAIAALPPPTAPPAGPGGVYEGEGRDFRYPLTLVDRDGNKSKARYKANYDEPNVLANGYYAFGANRLHIIKALDDVLSYLKQHHGLKIWFWGILEPPKPLSRTLCRITGLVTP